MLDQDKVEALLWVVHNVYDHFYPISGSRCDLSNAEKWDERFYDISCQLENFGDYNAAENVSELARRFQQTIDWYWR